MYQMAGLIALVLGFVLGGLAYDAVGGGFWGWLAGFGAFVATGWGVFLAGGLFLRSTSSGREQASVGDGYASSRVSTPDASIGNHPESPDGLLEIVEESLREDETLVLIAPGGVVTAELDWETEQMTPIDQFKPWEGWLAVTDSERTIYGRFGRRGQPQVRGVFSFTIWDSDPRGLVFRNEDAEPERMLVFQPQATASTAALHATLSKSLGDSAQIRQLQQLYANRVSFGATLEADYVEINRVYGMLRDLGADADQLLVDEEKAKHAGVMAVFEFYEPHLDPGNFDSWRSNRGE